MIPTQIRAEIVRRLRAAEIEHDVRVLMAVESGSRAWGFASPDSDYDVRFIFVHPSDWYLSVGLEEKRDVIEYPIVDDIDLNGWDLRKALRLFWRSNPAFVEWIQSPIVYEQQLSFVEQIRALIPKVYSPVSGVHHYRSMAKTNFRDYLKADLVPLKKYFYVLRPLLAIRWLERYQTAAPIEFEKLLQVIDDRTVLCADIRALLHQKRKAPELGLHPPVASIHRFIESELKRLESLSPRPGHRGEVLPHLDALFRRTLTSSSAVEQV